MTFPNLVTEIVCEYVDSIPTDTLRNVKGGDIYSYLLGDIKRPKTIHERLIVSSLNSAKWDFIDYYIQLKLDKCHRVENAITTR